MRVTHAGLVESESILSRKAEDASENRVSSDANTEAADYIMNTFRGYSTTEAPKAKVQAKASRLAPSIKASTMADRQVPINDDMLNHRVYAEALIDFITHKDSAPPFVMAITGKWGSGKTNLMRWVRDDLRRKGYPVSWFTAWRHNNREAIWAAFARQIIDDHISFFRDIRLRIMRVQDGWPSLWAVVVALVVGLLVVLFGHSLLERLGGAGSLNPVLAWSSGIIVLMLPFLRSLRSALHSPLRNMVSTSRGPDYTTKLGFQAEFERDFRRLVKITGTESKPLVIFIDDLDRAPPPIPAEIVEAVNHVVDERNCIFVIGLDIEMVSASIEARYAAVISQLRQSPQGPLFFTGRRFLEKMIQIVFSFPPMDDEEFKKYAERLISPNDGGSGSTTEEQLRGDADVPKRRRRNAMSEKDSFLESFSESHEVKVAILGAAQYLPRNPRALKRFINNFRLVSFIANRQGLIASGEVSLTPLAALVTLNSSFPRIVEVLHRHDWWEQLGELVEALDSGLGIVPTGPQAKKHGLDGTYCDLNLKSCLAELHAVENIAPYLSLTRLVSVDAEQQ